MPCNCPYNADECDGSYATHYPLQDGGRCAVEKCRAPKPAEPEPTRSERMREAGFTRRPTWRSLPSDE